MHEDKTSEQLLTEIAYYERILATTSSLDRRERAQRGIRSRTTELLKRWARRLDPEGTTASIVELLSHTNDMLERFQR